MANQVNLTLAGDSAQLEKALQSAQDRAKRLADQLGVDSSQIEAAFQDMGTAAAKFDDEVKQSSISIEGAFKSAGDSAKRAGQDAKSGFETAAEGFDKGEQHAMGFHDSVTGVQDSMTSLSSLAKGDFTNALLFAGSGVADLASSVSNAAVPAMKSLGISIEAVKKSLGAVGVVLAIAGAAYWAYHDIVKKTDVVQEDINKDLDVFVKSGGTVTGALKRQMEATGSLAQNMKILTKTSADYTNQVSMLDSLLGRSSVSKWAAANDKATESIDKTDKMLAQLVDDGYDYNDVTKAAATSIAGFNEALNTGKLDDFTRAVSDAKQRSQALTGTIDDLAAAWKEAKDRAKEYSDQIHSQLDPLFAYTSAVKNQKQAQDDYNDAVKKFGAQSDEAKDAYDQLTQSSIDLYTASSDLSTVNRNDLLVTLKALEDQGFLTAAQVADITSKVDNAADSVKRANGVSADMFLNLHIDETDMLKLQSGYWAQYGQHVAAQAAQQAADAASLQAYQGNLPPGFNPYGFSGEPTAPPAPIQNPGPAPAGFNPYGFASGGDVPGTPGEAVLAIVHAGEHITRISDKPDDKAASYSYGDTTINVTLNMSDLKQLQDLQEFLNLLRNNSRRGLVTV